MANILLYSKHNLPIYGIDNKPVHGDMFMPTLEIEITRTDWYVWQHLNAQSCFVFGPENLIGDDFGSLTVDKNVFALMDFYEDGLSWFGTERMLNFVEANGSTGWGWHGTYWQFDMYGWSRFPNHTADYEFRILNQTITTSYVYPLVFDEDPVVLAAIKVCTVRYTPSTNVLEFIT